MDKEKLQRQHELHSEEVEDILGSVPSWITRNGTILLAVFIAVLFIGTWIFRFPDIRKAEIIVSSLNPPADIVARANGKVEELLVTDNDEVAEGEILAVIENPADLQDMLSLEERLGLLGEVEVVTDLEIPRIGTADLGPVQDEYAEFYKNYRGYRDFLSLNYHQRKIELLTIEYKQYVRYANTLNAREKLLQEEFLLAENQFRRDSSLFVQNVLAESEYESSRSGMLTKREDFEEVRTLNAENDIRMAAIQTQMLDLELKEQEQENMLENQVVESLDRLTASIAQWKKDYLIVAPINGAVTFNTVWSENQNVSSGDRVMTVIPSTTGTILGKVRLPMEGAADVRPGQTVNIRFDNYPYMKYGMVTGIVENVSRVPEQGSYTVDVNLPDGLMTNFDRRIELHQNMEGIAEIMTDKMRLIQRIFNPIRNTYSKQQSMRT